MSEIRVRFAPSPTGYLHIGGARTALFNWLFAKKMGGKMVLRIEDTDTERLKEDSVSQILTSLKWLGLNWDEGPEAGGEYGPYYQSERQEIYTKFAQQLVAEGKAYYCFCTSEELEAEREKQRAAKEPFRYARTCRELDPAIANARREAGEPCSIRIKIPTEGSVVVHDLIHGDVTFDLKQLDDFVIVKSNGMPTYNFAVVVDDHLMKMSHVLRAEEHLSNTPKQLLIYEALGWEPPAFGHMPMILAPDRSKLSKRHGATSVEEFRDQGYLPEAIVNYLTLLGWGPGDEREIFSLAETVELFELEQMSKKAAVYDHLAVDVKFIKKRRCPQPRGLRQLFLPLFRGQEQLRPLPVAPGELPALPAVCPFQTDSPCPPSFSERRGELSQGVHITPGECR